MMEKKLDSLEHLALDALLLGKKTRPPNICKRCVQSIHATIGVKRDRFINLIGFKRLTIDAFMTGLAALSSRTCCRFRFGRLDDILRCRLGGVGGILREFSDLVGKLGVFLDKRFMFGNLLFKFRDAMDIELFFSGSRVSSSSHLLWLLSGERGSPLEKTGVLSA